ncbi:MAG: MarR family transcriptional regulator [Lentisphaeria bacterium]|nr:MarR family transcriptional regulator [Lentisphaeria bacterium]
MDSNRTYECWRTLLALADDFREQANRANLDSQLITTVTVGQLRVLKAVANLTFDTNTEGLMLKTLAEKVKLTSGAVSIIVDALVKQGLLERRHNSTDRRAVNIVLSDAGREKVARYSAFYTRLTENFFRELSEEEQKQLSSLLTRFREKIRREQQQN